MPTRRAWRSSSAGCWPTPQPGGTGLGTYGFHEPKVAELCAEAGFSSVRRVEMENPFNSLYEMRP